MRPLALPTAAALAALAFAGPAVAADPAPATQPAGVAAPADRTKATAAAPTQRSTNQRAETRDWSKVDTNADHLISPDEMEGYLKADPGPLSRSAKS